MDSERILKGYGRTTTTFEEGGEFYIQKDIKESMSGKAGYSVTYVKINKEEYLNRLKQLSKQIATNPSVKIEDVIFDALKDYPLSYIESYEKAVNKEMAKPKPSIKTRGGYCCELVIGNGLSFVLRN